MCSPSQAKIIFAKQNAVFSINLKQIQNEVKDGEVIDIPAKSLGSTEHFPLAIRYSPNGRYFAVLSDKEFVISTSGVYRNSCVGTCSDISWNEGETFAIKEGSSVKIYKELKEHKNFKPGFSFDAVLGGPFISVRTTDSIYLYDSDNGIFIRKIDVTPTQVIWNENKRTLALICEDITYILNAYIEKIEKYIEDVTEGGVDVDEEGCQDAFEPRFEINDKIVNGLFIDDVFIYINTKNKINYAIDDKIFSITTLNSNYSLLGYLPSTNKIYLMNKSFNLISYTFPLSFVSYQMAILKGNYEQAEKVFSTIPPDYIERVTNFLEKFEHYELCYHLCSNINQKFSLAIKLKKLKDAWHIASEQNSADKLKMVADLALDLGEFKYAEEAMVAANDLNGLLLYYSCIQDRQSLHTLALMALSAGMYNIAFSCYFQLNEVDICLNVLIESQKLPEAALFCRTYLPSRLNSVLELWNEEINKDESNSRISNLNINII
jgi:coatomer subunit beta'